MKRMEPISGYFDPQIRRIVFVHARCVPEAERSRFVRRFDGSRENRSCRFCGRPFLGLQKGWLASEQKRLSRLGIAAV